MRIVSLIGRDDFQKTDGGAVISLAANEITLLNNLLYQVTKEASYQGPLLTLHRDMMLLNAIVQHRGVDSFDIDFLHNLNRRIYQKGGPQDAV